MDDNFIEAHGVRVEFVELGEGYNGEYDESDPQDVELLRFDVHVHQSVPGARYDEDCHEGNLTGWYYVDSYCTNIPVTATSAQRTAMLALIHIHIGVPPTKIKMGEASWFTLDMLERTPT